MIMSFWNTITELFRKDESDKLSDDKGLKMSEQDIIRGLNEAESVIADSTAPDPESTRAGQLFDGVGVTSAPSDVTIRPREEIIQPIKHLEEPDPADIDGDFIATLLVEVDAGTLTAVDKEVLARDP